MLNRCKDVLLLLYNCICTLCWHNCKDVLQFVIKLQGFWHNCKVDAGWCICKDVLQMLYFTLCWYNCKDMLQFVIKLKEFWHNCRVMHLQGCVANVILQIMLIRLQECWIERMCYSFNTCCHCVEYVDVMLTPNVDTKCCQNVDSVASLVSNCTLLWRDGCWLSRLLVCGWQLAPGNHFATHQRLGWTSLGRNLCLSFAPGCFCSK